MLGKTIEVREWEPSPSIALTRDEVRAVSRAFVASGDTRRSKARFVEVLAGDEPGEYRLRATSYVGALRAGSIQILVRPKVGDAKALYLAAVTEGLEPRSELVELETERGLVEVIIPLLVNSVESLLRRGLREDYQSVADDAPVLRGRLDFARQIAKRPGLPLPLAVRFEELSRDTPANRLLRSAVEFAVDHRLGAASDRRRARELLRHFDDVRPAPSADAVAPPSDEYRNSLVLARLLLSSTSVDLHLGGTAVDGLVFDMNAIFQRFVFLGISRRLAKRGVGRLVEESRGQSLHLDEESAVSLEPDFALWQGDRCRLVGDVKYKDLDVRGVPNADVYQVLAYATAANLTAALLVYAGSGGFRDVTIRHSDVRVRIVNLDVRRSASEIEDQLDAIAEEAFQIATHG